jgi:hypothetical protein
MGLDFRKGSGAMAIGGGLLSRTKLADLWRAYRLFSETIGHKIVMADQGFHK